MKLEWNSANFPEPKTKRKVVGRATCVVYGNLHQCQWYAEGCIKYNGVLRICNAFWTSPVPGSEHALKHRDCYPLSLNEAS